MGQQWAEMSNEEYQHALIIRRIIGSDSQNNIVFSQGELRSATLNASIKHIEGIISEFTKNKTDFTIARSANIALQLERGLWENKIFQCFDGDSEEVKKVLSSLHLEQKVHISKIHNFALQFSKITNEQK